jgi:uncharacterized protein (TIGR03435 family)
VKEKLKKECKSDRRRGKGGSMNTRTLLAVAFILSVVIYSRGQSSPARAEATPQIPQWQIDAGLKMSFDVASVTADTAKPSRTNVSSNISMGRGDYYSPTGGLFLATNFPLADYVAFAYKLPAWDSDQVSKRVLSDRFDIQARVDGNPTKDQMRLMMQTLLEDRFKLVMHREIRQLPVYALVLDKAGELGPGLQPHVDNAPCSTDPGPTPVPGTVFACGGIQEVQGSVPDRVARGARKVTMELIANSLGGLGHADRPVIDKTGLAGTFDMHLEFSDGEFWNGIGSRPWHAAIRPGPTFIEAPKEQLGLKLEPQTAPVEIFLLDHIEKPSAN